ncbi:hypothetical protein LENED_004636 [Lentinula edodes]|uniref:Uncharacterized protein n=1 Tax=Lentinula edodes TaxID=5353 RepID=A0A1Q3E714_LENED|nr:hypothetical protein LENED_004636 [Lentinula edodes]
MLDAASREDGTEADLRRASHARWSIYQSTAFAYEKERAGIWAEAKLEDCRAGFENIGCFQILLLDRVNLEALRSASNIPFGRKFQRGKLKWKLIFGVVVASRILVNKMIDPMIITPEAPLLTPNFLLALNVLLCPTLGSQGT